MLHHESLCPQFQGAGGIGHNFVASQSREVREASGVQKQGKIRLRRRGSVRSASPSSGGWVRTGEEESGVFRLGGMALGGMREHRVRWKSITLVLSSAGKDLQRRPEAGLIHVREKMSLRAAIRLLCGRSTVSGGRHYSAASIGTGVDGKELVTHLCTCHKWTTISL